MQDRVIFRFWDTKERVMLDWDCICQTAFNCTRKEGNEIQRYGLMYFVFTTPQRFIPLQCTGLRDKNGKLIYEGDIVHKSGSKFNGEKIISEIEWCETSAHFVYSDYIGIGGSHEFRTGTAGKMEVLGNIYENPELIKEKI